MGTRFLVLGLAAISILAQAGAACAQSLPPILPLNGTVGASTCSENLNEPCDSTVYPSPTATSRFTLDEPSTVNTSEESAIGSCGYFMLAVETTPGEWIFGAGFDD